MRVERPRPDFLCIGAHKAGTTWLYKQLSIQANIWMPKIKELHYFDRDVKYPSPNDLAATTLWERATGSEKYKLGRVKKGFYKTLRSSLRSKDAFMWNLKWYFGTYDDVWYTSLFPVDKKLITGEITPSYSILDEEDIRRIYAINPEMKIIFMLRNPVDRAWSALRFVHDKGYSCFDINNIEEIITEFEAPGYLLRGDYLKTLRNFSGVFDEVVIAFYDAIEDQPEELLRQIGRYIGVEKSDIIFQNTKGKFNQSSKIVIPGDLEEYLFSYYKPMMESMVELFGGYCLDWVTGQKDNKSKQSTILLRDLPVDII